MNLAMRSSRYLVMSSLNLYQIESAIIIVDWSDVHGRILLPIIDLSIPADHLRPGPITRQSTLLRN